MGEHAAVYGRPALVAAVGLRTTVALEAGGRGVRIALSGLGWRGAETWDSIRSKTDRARDAWRRFIEFGGCWAPPDARDPSRLVTIALGEALRALELGAPPDVEVTIASRIPPSSGFGSSAALGVAIAGAFVRLVGVAGDGALVAGIAREVERRQHGTPSGVDAAAAQRGGLLWARGDRVGAVAVEAVTPRSPVLSGLALFHTGSPDESTGEVVAHVRQRLEADAGLASVLDTIEETATALRRDLESPVEEPSRILTAIRTGEAALERLGVVPGAVAAVIREIERAGGAAKVSGAGATRGDRAGAVVVYHPDRSWADRWSPPSGWRRFEAPLAVEGLREEDPV